MAGHDPATPDGAGTRLDAPIVVGFIGRLVPEKGVLVLLDAVARRSAASGSASRGAGPLGDRTRGARAVTRGIADRVELVGRVAPDDVVDFYRALDVLAVPSLPTPSWTEQFGRVAVEAMACGVPVVSSDAGALPDVVGGAGIVVPGGRRRAHSATALVEAGGPRAAELRASGLARAAECTWEAVGRDYLELYRSVRHEASDRLARGSRSSSSPTAPRPAPPTPSSRWPPSRSRSSTTRRCPRSRRCAPSWACGTSTPAATAASPPASTSRSPTGCARAPTCCC